MRTGWDRCTFCLGDMGCRALDPEVGNWLRLSWPFWRSGVVSDCILHVEYKLSNDEFMSFTKASRSTSSSERQNKSSIMYPKVPDKKFWKTEDKISANLSGISTAIFLHCKFLLQKTYLFYIKKNIASNSYKKATGDHVLFCLPQ